MSLLFSILLFLFHCLFSVLLCVHLTFSVKANETTVKKKKEEEEEKKRKVAVSDGNPAGGRQTETSIFHL